MEALGNGIDGDIFEVHFAPLPRVCRASNSAVQGMDMESLWDDSRLQPDGYHPSN